MATGKFYVLIQDKKELYIEPPEEGYNHQSPMPIVRIFVKVDEVMEYLKQRRKAHPSLNLNAYTIDMNKLFAFDLAWGSRIEICSVKPNRKPEMIDLLFDASAILS